MLDFSSRSDIINLPIKEADFLCQNAPLVCERERTVFLIGRRGRGFLLGEDMKTKVCYKCKEEKPLSHFRQYKSGINKGYYRSYCNKCAKIYNSKKAREYNAKYYLKHPWANTLKTILTRCHCKTTSYYRKGIKNYLNTAELKFLWFRDRAFLMKKPSIDRIKRKGHYTFNNCRYMELLDNLRRKRKV